jgi:hypothetical protein
MALESNTGIEKRGCGVSHTREALSRHLFLRKQRQKPRHREHAPRRVELWKLPRTDKLTRRTVMEPCN